MDSQNFNIFQLKNINSKQTYQILDTNFKTDFEKFDLKHQILHLQNNLGSMSQLAMNTTR